MAPPKKTPAKLIESYRKKLEKGTAEGLENFYSYQIQHFEETGTLAKLTDQQKEGFEKDVEAYKERVRKDLEEARIKAEKDEEEALKEEKRLKDIQYNQRRIERLHGYLLEYKLFKPSWQIRNSITETRDTIKVGLEAKKREINQLKNEIMILEKHRIPNIKEDMKVAIDDMCFNRVKIQKELKRRKENYKTAIARKDVITSSFFERGFTNKKNDEKAFDAHKEIPKKPVTTKEKIEKATSFLNAHLRVAYERKNVVAVRFEDVTDKKDLRIEADFYSPWSCYSYTPYRTRFIKKLKEQKEIKEGYHSFHVDFKAKMFYCIYINMPYFVYLKTMKKVNFSTWMYSKYQPVVKDFKEDFFINKNNDKKNEWLPTFDKDDLWSRISQMVSERKTSIKWNSPDTDSDEEF
jgi:hypothetical protein